MIKALLLAALTLPVTGSLHLEGERDVNRKLGKESYKLEVIRVFKHQSYLGCLDKYNRPEVGFALAVWEEDPKVVYVYCGTNHEIGDVYIKRVDMPL